MTPLPRLVASAFALALALPLPAAAQELPPRTIVVSGHGEASAAPDEAQISAGVVAQGQTAAQALDANAAAMTRVFDALSTLGIPENRIRTSNFALSPQYPPFRSDTPGPRNIVGYEVANQVTVILDDIVRVGITADALVRVGANQINNISFSISDPAPLAEEARRLAVADAAAKAETLAEAAGVTLGPVLAIQEGGVAVPVAREAFALAAAPVTPIAGGEQSVTVNVSITYAIE